MTKIRDNELIISFGKKVRKLRLEKGYSQGNLADLANINRSQIIDIESGRINTTISTLKSISIALEVSIFELIE